MSAIHDTMIAQARHTLSTSLTRLVISFSVLENLIDLFVRSLESVLPRQAQERTLICWHSASKYSSLVTSAVKTEISYTSSLIDLLRIG
jgi:hypothetical protein